MMVWLTNGTIIDGTGAPAYKGSVCIDDGFITDIRRGDHPTGDDVIDCTGKTITPGFIDAHSHHDFFAAREDNVPFFRPFIEQGVTTMIAGNCGFSAAGYDEDTPHQKQIGGGLFSNRGCNFGSFRTWRESADKELPLNMASLVGHGTLRIGAAGKGSSDLSEATMEKTLGILDASLSEGAAGVSFGLMYEPGQFASFDELKRFAEVARRHDKTVTVHARAYSKVSTSYQPPIGGRAHNLRAIDEVVRLIKETDAKTVLSHLIFVGKRSWDTVGEALCLLEETAAGGHDVRFDMYAMTFGASVITVVLPPWYLTLPKAKRKTWWTRFRLGLEIWISKKALGFGFGDMLVTNTHGNRPDIEGKTVADIADERGVSELAAYLDIIEHVDETTAVLMYQYQTPSIIERLRKHPLVHYMSDAWIEEEAGIQNYAVYGNFVKFLELAREHDDGMEAAVHRMSGKPAAYYGLEGRGTIAVGHHADMVVFDRDELAHDEDRPGRPDGIEHVFINGVRVVRQGTTDDDAISRKPGRFIRV